MTYLQQAMEEAGILTPNIQPEQMKDIHLTEEAANQIFIFMLKKYLGTEKLCELAKDAATDMEVYGLINNAEELKGYCAKIQSNEGSDRCKKPAVITAIKLAISEDDPLAKEYLELEEKEHQIIGQIMEKYGDVARKEIGAILDHAARKAMVMNGPRGRDLQSAISAMSES